MKARNSAKAARPGCAVCGSSMKSEHENDTKCRDCREKTGREIMEASALKVVWEGVLWTLVKRIHNPGTPLKCDGCETMTEWRDRFHGDNGQEAYWCPECVDMVKGK